MEDIVVADKNLERKQSNKQAGTSGLGAAEAAAKKTMKRKAEGLKLSTSVSLLEPQQALAQVSKYRVAGVARGAQLATIPGACATSIPTPTGQKTAVEAAKASKRCRLPREARGVPSPAPKLHGIIGVC
jgi:hypothetical protein